MFKWEVLSDHPHYPWTLVPHILRALVSLAVGIVAATLDEVASNGRIADARHESFPYDEDAARPRISVIYG